MATPVKACPEGYHTVNAALAVRGGAQAIEFYKKAFGAEERGRFASPDGKKLMHAALKIGDAMIMLHDENPDMNCPAPQTLGGTSVTLYLYVPDADKTFNQAVAAGAKSTMPIADMFWGDRMGAVTDPFGHSWNIATHKEDVSPEEMKKRGKAFFEQMEKQHA